MNNIELVLDCCKNYDRIINFKIDDNDTISRDLISYYKEYVFFNYDDKTKISLLDEAMYEYVSNRDFYNYVQDRLKNFDDILPFDDDINKIYNEFKYKSVRTISSCRWI